MCIRDSIWLINKKPDDSFKFLSADFDINLSGKKGGSVSGATALAMVAKLDYMKLISAPGEAFKYETTLIDEISVAGEVGSATFGGSLNFIKDDAIYGSGLKGAFQLGVDAAGFQLDVQAIGQFGKTDHDHSKDYRYFFIDAKAAFDKGIPLCPGLDLYGFGGGLSVNMSKALVDLDPESSGSGVVDSTPGKSFSGTIYTPKHALLGLNANILMGAQGKPDVATGEVELGLEMNYETSGLEKIFLKGDLYAMSEGLAKRYDAAVRANIHLSLIHI